jgi:hypothetical protein
MNSLKYQHNIENSNLPIFKSFTDIAGIFEITILFLYCV